MGTTARRTKFALRYGDGLYFSSVSGKANDYATLSEKVQILCFLGTLFLGHTYGKSGWAMGDKDGTMLMRRCCPTKGRLPHDKTFCKVLPNKVTHHHGKTSCEVSYQVAALGLQVCCHFGLKPK